MNFRNLHGNIDMLGEGIGLSPENSQPDASSNLMDFRLASVQIWTSFFNGTVFCLASPTKTRHTQIPHFSVSTSDQR
jgi:hypothetical protein